VGGHVTTAALPKRPPALSWRREILLFVAAYIAYSIARGATTGSLDTALENARLIIDLQAQLGIGVEHTVQNAMIDLPIMWTLNGLYIIAQFAVLPAALVWVYRRRRSLYPRLRTTVLATWAIALPVYTLFPTAPPRLAGIGILDTVSSQTSVALDSPMIMAFYNPVAAVPSLHAGFAFAVGMAIAASARPMWARIAALAWGPAVALVVIATGNHFVLDVVFGMVAVTLGYCVALLLHRAPAGPRRIRAAAYPALGLDEPETLRVALVCPYDWQTPGGVRTHVAGLAEALRWRGHHVDIVAAGSPSASEPGLTLIGPVHPIRANGSIARIALGPLSGRRVLRALAKGRYDVVHLHEPLVPMAGIVALRHRGSTLVGTFHMFSPTALTYRLLGPLLRRPLRSLSSRIAVSEPAAACASRVTRGDLLVIPNGISVRPPVQERPARAHDAPGRIVFIGRHEPRKGLAVLLRALREVPADVELHLIGVAPDELDDADLRDDERARIVAHGRVDDEERHRLLRGADALCAPSLGGESFGLVLAEAMAERVPVIATAIPGYREVLPEDCGRLVPPGDHEALASALAEVLTDPDLRRRMGAAGADSVASFDWSAVSARVDEEYRRAIRDDARALDPARAPVTATAAVERARP
jgi:phosphatidyl-myo-inositol alpha-mannosyltransferase